MELSLPEIPRPSISVSANQTMHFLNAPRRTAKRWDLHGLRLPLPRSLCLFLCPFFWHLRETSSDAIHRDPRRLLCRRSSSLILREASSSSSPRSLSRTVLAVRCLFSSHHPRFVCAANAPRSRLTFCNGKTNFRDGCRIVCAVREIISAIFQCIYNTLSKEISLQCVSFIG